MVQGLGYLEMVSRSAGETRRLGQDLGELAQTGDVVLLIGSLGAGKTCLAQGLARGLGVAEAVISPSFVLIREYRGRLPFYHLDFYRLEAPAELEGLGLDLYLYGPGVCAVEWADRGLEHMPRENLTVRMAYLSPRRRGLRLEAQGPRYLELLSRLRGRGWGG